MRYLVRHREKPTNASRYCVLRQRRISVFPKFLKRGLLKLNAQFTRLTQVFRDIIAKDSESALHSCAGGDRSARTAPKVGVVKISKTISRATRLTAFTPLFP